MRTPAGFECQYFYGDYRRGRTREECRLLDEAPTPQKWTRDLCRTCPVPSILRANACPNLILNPLVEPTFLGLRKRVKITAFCLLSKQIVGEPHIGCGQCHPLPTIFSKESDDPDVAT